MLGSLTEGKFREPRTTCGGATCKDANSRYTIHFGVTDRSGCRALEEGNQLVPTMERAALTHMINRVLDRCTYVISRA
jgi:hypothetical protein